LKAKRDMICLVLRYHSILSMLLEIENQLHKRVHSALGQSAVVLRLAEELDQSGRVAEQAMIVVSWTGGSTENPNKGAYIPTVRTRTLTYNLTLVQKQAQREGHSFCLPILDILADSINGWVPEVPGLEFQTGFELGPERFVQVTKESSQFIYEQTYSISVLLHDGRFYSQPCAAFDPVNVGDFLPNRKCLVTPGENSRQTGLAVWRRTTGVDETEKFVVEDSRCNRAIGDRLSVNCTNPGDGNATYVFVPSIAVKNDGTIDQTKVVSGSLSNVWKCTKRGIDSGLDIPPWLKLEIDAGLWRNSIGTIPNTDPDTSSYQNIDIKTVRAYNGKSTT
jgi:hypothetical protein